VSKRRSKSEPEPVTFFISGSISFEGNNQLDPIVKFLLIKPKPLPRVQLLISSGGGHDATGLALYCAMRAYQNRGGIVQTIGLGHVGSAAVLILAAGSLGDRFLDKYATVLVHRGSTLFSQQVSHPQLRNWVDHTDIMAENWDAIMYELTGTDWRAILEDNLDHWLNAENARVHGLVDILF